MLLGVLPLLMRVEATESLRGFRLSILRAGLFLDLTSRASTLIPPLPEPFAERDRLRRSFSILRDCMYLTECLGRPDPERLRPRVDDLLLPDRSRDFPRVRSLRAHDPIDPNRTRGRRR